MRDEGAYAFQSGPQVHRDPHVTGRGAICLVPLHVFPSTTFEDAGFSNDQKFDLLAWLLQIGPGAPDAALAVIDIMFDLYGGMVWLRVGVLGATGYGHVDVVLALQEPSALRGRTPADVNELSPRTLSSFGSLADAYIDTITGPHATYQQLSLLDPRGRPCW